MAQHKLKMHFWNNGTLVTQEHKFNDFESATEFASMITKESLLRIYNEYNELVFENSTINLDVASQSPYD